MGDFDFVKAVLDRIGDMRWMQIAIKPAKPFAFGLDRRHARCSACPATPCLRSCQLRAAGPSGAAPDDGPRRALDRPRSSDSAGEQSCAPHPMASVHFIRVRARWADGVVVATPVGGQGSHQLAAHRPPPTRSRSVPDGAGIAIGGPVDLILLDGPRDHVGLTADRGRLPRAAREAELRPCP